ncbi:MAG: TlpA family protein disulfide reductase [Weeksellaceae bacterium]|nr:TlpA family protein disulfide reductase [Weeksellaceae bacterium]
MKKFALYSLAAISVLACKKDDQKPAETIIKQDSVATSNQKSDAKMTPLVELSSEKMVTYLQNNNSDTLYVTNFFATWCGPCVQEIPFFRQKMDELKGQPVKFTFVSLDNKSDWNSEVSNFVDKQNIRKQVVLLDGSLLKPQFFEQNFKTWDGGAIPFTLIKKGDKVDETLGSMSEEALNQKIAQFLAAK